MPRLLKDRVLVADRWTRITDHYDLLDTDHPVLVPLACWQERRGALLDRPPQLLGVWMNGEDEPALIGPDAGHFGCIAIHFPAFMDGRGFSCGRLLRERYGYRGELRAIGDIIPDQLHYLWRCGFDAFELPDAVSLDTARNCLKAFSTAYQADARPAG